MKWIAAVGALLVLAGCDTVHWLQPLAREGEEVREPGFAGRWMSPDCKDGLTVEGTDAAYRILSGDDKLQGVLIRLGGDLYLDVVNPEATGIPDHTYLRVEIGPDRLAVWTMEDAVVRQTLRDGGLAHVRRKEGKDTRWVVTADTVDIQSFLARQRERLWTEGGVEYRKVVEP